jgi:hypothetical protein
MIPHFPLKVSVHESSKTSFLGEPAIIWKSGIAVGITYALVQGSIISILNAADVILPEDSSFPEILML